MGTKKKRNGHYCKICNQYKANEKFSGKGHSNHICKSCSQLSQEQRNEKMRMNKIERIELSGFFISKENKVLLKRYANDERYKEAAEYAGMVLNEFYARMEDYNETKKQEKALYDEIDDDWDE